MKRTSREVYAVLEGWKMSMPRLRERKTRGMAMSFARLSVVASLEQEEESLL